MSPVTPKRANACTALGLMLNNFKTAKQIALTIQPSALARADGLGRQSGTAKNWSGRPGSNRRRPAWEAGILPLNYARSEIGGAAVEMYGIAAGLSMSLDCWRATCSRVRQ